MYYKITDKTSEKYKKLHDLRKEELAIEERNEAKLKERFPNWNGKYLGRSGQQNFNRVTTYSGLGFDENNKINPKEWRESKKHKGFYEPYLRTKAGREVAKFLKNLERSCFWEAKDIIGFETYHRISFPYIEIGKDDILYIYLDDKIKPSEEFVEITSVEFKTALGLK